MVKSMDMKRIGDNAIKRFEESRLFTKEFGTFSKSDYEILLFTIYLDSVEDPVRDYDLSVNLGITESKVRNLRVKSQLLYPRNLDSVWKEQLANAIEHGYYNSTSNEITISIEDPSVRNMIRNKIELQFGTVNISLNSKQLVLPVDSYLKLAALAEGDPNSALKRLNKEYRAIQESMDIIESPDLKHRILETTQNVIPFVAGLSNVFSTGNQIYSALTRLLRISH